MAGEDRLIAFSRTEVRLTAQHLAELRATVEDLLLKAREQPDAHGVRTTVLWTAVDREDRRGSPPGRVGDQPDQSAGEVIIEYFEQHNG